MRHAKVLKSFPYAHDGINIRDLEKGEVVEIKDDVFDGLVKEKLIKEVEAPAEVPEQQASETAEQQQSTETQDAQTQS